MLGFLRSKKILGLGIFFVLLFGLTITVYQVRQRQQIHSNAAETQTNVFLPDTKLADFNGTPILVSDLDALTAEQYGTSQAETLTADQLDTLLNIYVERKILDSQN